MRSTILGFGVAAMTGRHSSAASRSAPVSNAASPRPTRASTLPGAGRLRLLERRLRSDDVAQLQQHATLENVQVAILRRKPTPA